MEYSLASGAAPAAATSLFALWSEQTNILGSGKLAALPSGNADSLARRTADFFAAHSSGPQLLMGALPFDRHQSDALFQPQTASRFASSRELLAALGSGLAPVQSSQRWRIDSAPSPAEYAAAVARAVELIDATSVDMPRKVVLSRTLLVNADHPLDVRELVRRLSQDTSVTTFVVPLPPAANGQPRRLVGATPELLIAKTGTQVISHPLAGSARRYADAAADSASANALLDSEKDQREHRAVVEAILDTLAPHCSQLAVPKHPTLRSTASMWHLGTRIEGSLKDNSTPCTELLSALHPTPAVCGTPRQWARDLISQLEPMDRGFYAGAVGWTDAAGDGAWYVSIRCAEVSGTEARLFAGAGIVSGSDPATETHETAAKFVAMLEGLGVDRATVQRLLES